jgi:short-subunit dehydrogenase
MDFNEGRHAVITGAASGIGRELAIQLNRAGCRLSVSDVNEAGLRETVSLLTRPEVQAHSHVIDVADRQQMHQWADDIEAQHGCVDIVINNAGVALAATAQESSYEDLDWLIGINFWGVVHGTKAFLPLLQKSSQGQLVNISSIFGIVSLPTQSAYNAAKFAVRGYTEALRQEMAGSNVHVMCVHPGGIKTNIARAARSADPAADAETRGREFEKFAPTTPESAAAQIIAAMGKKKKRLLIGRDAKLASLVNRLLPVGYTRFMPKI